MTVVAGAIKDGRDLRADLHVRLDRLSRINRRIRSRRPDELNDDKGGEKNNHHPFEDAARFTHALLICALELTMKPGFMCCTGGFVSETKRN